MAFCRNCGAQLPEGAAFCVKCGARQAADPTPRQINQAPRQVNPNVGQYGYNGGYAQPQQPNFGNVYQSEAQDIKDNKVMAVLAYIGILVLIPMFAAKDSKYARYHAEQGTKVAILSIAYSIVSGIISLIVSLLLPVKKTTFLYYTYSTPNPVAIVISVILGIASLVFFAAEIIGIVYAATGEKKEIPLVNKIPILNRLVTIIFKAINKEK